MDTVFIKGLRARTTIGVYKKERHIKQLLFLDMSLGCDTQAAGLSDQVTDALDYDAISRRSIEFVENSSFQLIEAVANQLCELLLKEFPIKTISLTVSKPGAVSKAENVGVTIQRSLD